MIRSKVRWLAGAVAALVVVVPGALAEDAPAEPTIVSASIRLGDLEKDEERGLYHAEISIDPKGIAPADLFYEIALTDDFGYVVTSGLFMETNEKGHLVETAAWTIDSEDCGQKVELELVLAKMLSEDDSIPVARTNLTVEVPEEYCRQRDDADFAEFESQ